MIRFAYDRPYLEGQPTITVAYVKVLEKTRGSLVDDVVRIDCAYSACSPKDRFEKKIGRDKAQERLLSVETNKYQFSLLPDEVYSMLTEDVYGLANILNESFIPYIFNYMKHSAISMLVTHKAVEIESQRDKHD